jgi:hypothetical protein
MFGRDGGFQKKSFSYLLSTFLSPVQCLLQIAHARKKEGRSKIEDRKTKTKNVETHLPTQHRQTHAAKK